MTLSKLKVPLAFFTVLIIWSSTPLAIQWSSGTEPLTSALLRMVIGVLFSGVVLGVLTTKLTFSVQTLRIYTVGGISIFLGMSLFYLAAQEIPSGWIAVLFGLSPLTTGVISAMVEPETRLTPSRVAGLLLGIGGLYLVFSAGLSMEDASLYGVTLTLLGTLNSSIASVITRQMVKDQDITGMQITTGSLLIAIPLFFCAAWYSNPTFDLNFTDKAALSILYLGLIGTGVGFTLYYFLLKHVTANRISLITLITPISALSLGSWLNNEPMVAEVWMGAALVCTGLLLYGFKPRLGLRRL